MAGRLGNIVFAGAAIVTIMLLYGCSRQPEPITAIPPQGDEAAFTAYLTGYSYWDNTPPQSKAIARPVVHKEAGGTGSYDDPVTIAVGHRIESGTQTLDYPVGTLFYIPRLKKYALVEDVCGDGDMPQLGPCHIGYRGKPWLDIYIGGDGVSAEQAEYCTRQITRLQPVIIHPAPGREVLAGPIVEANCTWR